MTEPQLLGDRYELDGVVGRGGMAEVYQGWDRRLERQVAIKTLRADLTGDSTFQERFRREAQSAASLNHPAVVAVYDTGEDALNGATVPFIVMEYVPGRTLRDMLLDERELVPERGLEIVEGVLRALEYSHSRGVVHRDIKPGNIMITPEREVKVMDFGIARALHDASSTMTQTAQVVGTAQYLSPEQARGERVDARSDLYSLGCVLYAILTGNPPFHGDSPVSIAYQHVREEPTPPSHVNPEAPGWADALVLKALAKDPENRYHSAGDMRADIQRALAGQQVSVGAAGAATAPESTMVLNGATETTPPREERAERRRRRRWLWVVPLVLAFLALAGLGGWLLAQSLGPTSSQVSVPNVVGFEQAAAERTLRDAGFQVEPTREFSDQQTQGLVFRQEPPATGTAEEGSTVEIFVSKGSETVSVPNLKGMSKKQAREQLRQNELTVGQITDRPSTQPQNQVLASDPSAGTEVSREDPVDLVVSTGPTKVPDVTGQEADAAASQLSNKGFSVNRQQRTTDQAEEGQVVDQSPQGGSKVKPQSTVTIFVAQAPEETTSPSPSPTSSPTSPGEATGNGNGGLGPLGLDLPTPAAR